MTDSQSPDRFSPLTRLAHMSLVVIIAVAFSGYFLGMQQTQSEVTGNHQAIPAPEQVQSEIATVVNYSARPARHLSPNANWRNDLSKLVSAQPDFLQAPVLSEARKEVALIRRAARRAYDGAPPTIPHAIDQTNPAVCMTCHEEGKIIDGLVATPLPHPVYSSCTQCHVESDSNIFRFDVAYALAGTEFVGKPAPKQGERYWNAAPPVIPHPVWMRENCMSCHGNMGTAGIQSSHPWRNSCTQCHAPAADQDQRDFLQTLASSDVFGGL